MTPLPLLASRLLEKDPMPVVGDYPTGLVWRWMVSMAGESFHGVELEKTAHVTGRHSSLPVFSMEQL